MKKRDSGFDGGAKDKSNFTLGAKRFAKISAVEGIVLTTPMKKRMADFDRQGMSAEQRRALIVRAYRKG